MSLLTLPPVWEPWTQKDLDYLTLEEIEHLHVMLSKKVYDLENQFVKETTFYKRFRDEIDRKEELRKLKDKQEQQLNNNTNSSTKTSTFGR